MCSILLFMAVSAQKKSDFRHIMSDDSTCSSASSYTRYYRGTLKSIAEDDCEIRCEEAALIREIVLRLLNKNSRRNREMVYEVYSFQKTVEGKRIFSVEAKMEYQDTAYHLFATDEYVDIKVFPLMTKSPRKAMKEYADNFYSGNVNWVFYGKKVFFEGQKKGLEVFLNLEDQKLNRELLDKFNKEYSQVLQRVYFILFVESLK